MKEYKNNLDDVCLEEDLEPETTICSCGGTIKKCAYNCDIDDEELWDCVCSRCGHQLLTFPKED